MCSVLKHLVLHVLFYVSFQALSYPNEREIQQNVYAVLVSVKGKGIHA